jgi:hypothetical protein
MSPITTSCIVFACVFSGALLGMALRNLLPEHHLDPDSRNIVNLGMALVGTMSALLLSLLIASAKSSFDAQRTEITQIPRISSSSTAFCPAMARRQTASARCFVVSL